MKLIISLIISTVLLSQSYSQDTNAVKYLPLKVGNVWVYYYTGNYQTIGQVAGFIKHRIIGTQQINNHLYYLTQSSAVIIYGTSITVCYDYQISNYWNTRIDSLTGIVSRFGGQCSTNPETTFDSLKSNKNDTFYLCSGPPFNADICTDTLNCNIFGNSFSAKSFYNQKFEGSEISRYAQNIGIVNYSHYQMNGSCTGNLVGCLINGLLYGDTNMVVGINQISTEIPSSFSLSQNYPNPFNPTTSIKFTVPQKSFVTITIYNVLGEEVTNLVSEEFSPGTYETNWDAVNYPSGVYYYKLVVGDNTNNGSYADTKKMVLLK